MAWSDGISDQDAGRVLARDEQGGDRGGGAVLRATGSSTMALGYTPARSASSSTRKR